MGEEERQVEVDAEKVSITAGLHTRPLPLSHRTPTYYHNLLPELLALGTQPRLARSMVARCARPHTALIVPHRIANQRGAAPSLFWPIRRSRRSHKGFSPLCCCGSAPRRVELWPPSLPATKHLPPCRWQHQHRLLRGRHLLCLLSVLYPSRSARGSLPSLEAASRLTPSRGAGLSIGQVMATRDDRQEKCSSSIDPIQGLNKKGRQSSFQSCCGQCTALGWEASGTWLCSLDFAFVCGPSASLASHTSTTAGSVS